MNDAIHQVETEISKAWASAHPALFTEQVLGFLARHPDPQWTLAVRQTAGFVFLKADRA